MYTKFKPTKHDWYKLDDINAINLTEGLYLFYSLSQKLF